MELFFFDPDWAKSAALVLSGAVSLVAVSVSAFSAWTVYKQIRANHEATRRQTNANIEERWISDFRTYLTNFVVASTQFRSYIETEMGQETVTETIKKGYESKPLVELMLNPAEKLHAELIKNINSLAFVASDKTRDDFQEIRDKVLVLAQRIIKVKWADIRQWNL